MVYDGARSLDRCTNYRHDHCLYLKESRGETYIEPSGVSQANSHPYSVLHDLDLLLDAVRAPNKELHPRRLRLINIHGLIHRSNGRLSANLSCDIPILAFEKGKNS